MQSMSNYLPRSLRNVIRNQMIKTLTKPTKLKISHESVIYGYTCRVFISKNTAVFIVLLATHDWLLHKVNYVELRNLLNVDYTGIR